MKLQERGQGVQFYEQGLFALCIAALNQWIETTDNEYTDESRTKCINKARENYAADDGTTNFEKHKMPDVCLTEYERALYKLREDTRDIMLIETLYQNQDASDVSKDSILQSFDDHPVTKFLKQQKQNELDK